MADILDGNKPTETREKQMDASEQKRALDSIETLTAYLIESHLDELEDSHGGDEDEPGEAPATCTYCRAIAEGRAVLTLAGRSIPHLIPPKD